MVENAGERRWWEYQTARIAEHGDHIRALNETVNAAVDAWKERHEEVCKQLDRLGGDNMRLAKAAEKAERDAERLRAALKSICVLFDTTAKTKIATLAHWRSGAVGMEDVARRALATDEPGEQR